MRSWRARAGRARVCVGVAGASGRTAGPSAVRRDGRVPRACRPGARCSPARAITLIVERRRRTARRSSRGPFCASSTMPAKVTAASSAPLARRPCSTSAAPSAPSRPSPVAVGGNAPHEGSSSVLACTPSTARRRRASHSAASRSPGEQGARSSCASVSTTSRRMPSSELPAEPARCRRSVGSLIR